MKRMESTHLLTKPEAARRAGIGLRQIRRACGDGELAEYRIGGWPRVRWAEVLAWIETTRGADRDRPSEPRQRREGSP